MIGGYTAGTGNRTSTFGALLVGRYDGDVLRVRRRRRHRASRSGRWRTSAPGCEALRTDDCPFDPRRRREYRRGATWVEPELRAIVEIAEFTNDGFVRHSSFIRLAGKDRWAEWELRRMVRTRRRWRSTPAIRSRVGATSS